MASTTTSLVAAPQAATPFSPLALWHLLSLDGPSVAALWTWFLARTAGLTLPPSSVAAIFVAVWILYVLDRLLDTRSLVSPLSSLQEHLAHPTSHPLEVRHYFHHRHRTPYRTGILIAAIILCALTPHLPPAALRLYLIEAALLLAWFAVVHASGLAAHLPKEFVVGLFFAAATFTPAVAQHPEPAAPLALYAVLFGAICTLNGLFIQAWEQTHTTLPAHPLTRGCIGRLPELTAVTALVAAVLALHGKPSLSLVPAACGLSAVLLLALHRNRCRLEQTTLRAAADLALLTPILFLPFTR